MSQTALVTGATGLLGRQVVKAFEAAGYNVVGTGFSRASPPQIRKVDIQNADEVSSLFGEVKPSVVVHCAADRQPDSCTNNPEGARKLNVGATKSLAEAAQSANAFLIYISTDYVFPGRPGEAPYAANAEPSPTNVYGQTKLDGEAAVLQTSSNAVVLRVPVLYGSTDPHDNNKESAVNILMDALQRSQKEKVKMDDYAIRYPTNTEDVGRVCADIAKLYTQSSGKDLPRVLQFSSEDKMTKHEIVQHSPRLWACRSTTWRQIKRAERSLVRTGQ